MHEHDGLPAYIRYARTIKKWYITNKSTTHDDSRYLLRDGKWRTTCGPLGLWASESAAREFLDGLCPIRSTPEWDAYDQQDD